MKSIIRVNTRNRTITKEAVTKEQERWGGRLFDRQPAQPGSASDL